MATKAQLFRSETQRKGGGVRKSKKTRTIDPRHTDTRNLSTRKDKQVGMALEDSESGRPSRKSTRASAHHGRNDTQLMKAAREASQTSKARAGRAQVARR
ncbi:MAG: hypothetical protein JNM17_08590 [Archangium sp.]|nr:hypothetical protein [Archangium sp.]